MVPCNCKYLKPFQAYNSLLMSKARDLDTRLYQHLLVQVYCIGLSYKAHIDSSEHLDHSRVSSKGHMAKY